MISNLDCAGALAGGRTIPCANRAAGGRRLRHAPGRWALAAFVAAGLLLAGVPQARAADSAEVQLQAFVTQVKSATGDFQQQVQGAQGAAKAGGQKAANGHFAFQRPGKFRWETTHPYDQLIVSDGQHVYQYDPDLDQVTERRAGQAIGASPAALLFGSQALDKAFKLQGQADHDGLQWLRATPKSADAGFVHADIGFAGGLPKRLELLDAFGQTTRIDFSDLRVNPKISAEQFQFTLPQGADLVRMD